MELKSLGKYQIVGKIGQGGMGEVYRASDPVLNRQVAIKTMVGGGGGPEDELRKRFLREAQSAALLNHSNIVTVFDFGEEQGCMYIVMELLEGRDLKSVILGPRLPLRAQLDLMEQICDGLAFAHSKGVVHRDLKPANLHVSSDGRVKIMDFGLAKIASSDLTRAGLIMGTPHYMSPEQVKGEPVTARSDVFALGAVFHELLCGRKAFDGDSMPSVMFQVMSAEPARIESLRPDVPASLAAVVRSALEKDPARRPADAAELGRALRAAAAGLGADETLSPAPRPAPAPQASGRGAAAALATLRAEDDHSGPPGPTIRQEEPTELAAPTVRRERAGRGPARAGAERPSSVPRASVPAPIVALVALAALAAGVAAWLVYTRAGPSPGAVPQPPAGATSAGPGVPSAQPAPVAPPAPPSGKEALAERDYRRAAELAQAALLDDPRHPIARDTLAAARSALRESETLAERVRAALRARDGAGATQALGRLVAHDPRSPELPELTRGIEAIVRAGGATAAPVATKAQTRAEGAGAGERSPARPPAPSDATPAEASAVERASPPSSAAAAPEPPPHAAAAPSGPAPRQLPAQPTPRAEDGVLLTLEQYRTSCERVDPVAIRRVFPLIKDDNLKAISRMSRYDIRFEDVSVRLEGDRHAVVTTLARYQATPKDARRAGSQYQKRETIRMERVDGAWVIRSID